LKEEEFGYKKKNYHCASQGITFTSLGFDKPSIDFLDKLGVPFFKIASPDLTTYPDELNLNCILTLKKVP